MNEQGAIQRAELFQQVDNLVERVDAMSTWMTLTDKQIDHMNEAAKIRSGMIKDLSNACESLLKVCRISEKRISLAIERINDLEVAVERLTSKQHEG